MRFDDEKTVVRTCVGRLDLLLQSDKKLLKKANTLLKDIERNGYSGLGKPEPLKDDLSAE